MGENVNGWPIPRPSDPPVPPPLAELVAEVAGNVAPPRSSREAPLWFGFGGADGVIVAADPERVRGCPTVVVVATGWAAPMSEGEAVPGAPGEHAERVRVRTVVGARAGEGRVVEVVSLLDVGEGWTDAGTAAGAVPALLRSLVAGGAS